MESVDFVLTWKEAGLCYSTSSDLTHLDALVKLFIGLAKRDDVEFVEIYSSVYAREVKK